MKKASIFLIVVSLLPTQVMQIVGCKGNMANWELEDIEIAARANPNTFFIPSETERRNQKVGDEVRLHFLLRDLNPDGPSGERMWVEIVKVDSEGKHYEGTLTNQPLHIRDLQMGDVIRFESRHIAQTIIKKGDPRWLDCAEKSAYVSKLVFEGERTLRFAYREDPDNEEDSGWRLFTGLETDQYVNDPKNIRICNVGWLTDFDPTLFEIFKSDYGSVFERTSKEESWKRVRDWKPAEK